MSFTLPSWQLTETVYNHLCARKMKAKLLRNYAFRSAPRSADQMHSKSYGQMTLFCSSLWFWHLTFLQADVIERLRLQYKKDLLKVVDIVLSHQVSWMYKVLWHWIPVYDPSLSSACLFWRVAYLRDHNVACRVLRIKTNWFYGSWNNWFTQILLRTEKSLFVFLNLMIRSTLRLVILQFAISYIAIYYLNMQF